MTPPRWSARRTGWAWGREALRRFEVAEQTTRALGELARSCHTTVSTVLQGAWAQLLMSLTGRHDVAFGTTVSGRPAEVAGADSMVGLFINTVPVRASITAATTTADLLDQLQNAYNHTLEHQHLALSEIHRVTGQDQLFDTFFVYENYPLDAAALSGTDGLAVTEFTHREYNHYPLAIQALPGSELGLRVEFDTDVFDAGRHRNADRALRAGVGGDDRRIRPGGCRRWMCWMTMSAAAWTGGAIGRCWHGRTARRCRFRSCSPRRWNAHPDALAVTFEGCSMTYRELDEAAIQLAQLLAARGVGPGQRVALLLPRSAAGDRGDAGGGQDRRGLCADRSGGAGGADAVRAR